MSSSWYSVAAEMAHCRRWNRTQYYCVLEPSGSDANGLIKHLDQASNRCSWPPQQGECSWCLWILSTYLTVLLLMCSTKVGTRKACCYIHYRGYSESSAMLIGLTWHIKMVWLVVYFIILMRWFWDCTTSMRNSALTKENSVALLHSNTCFLGRIWQRCFPIAGREWCQKLNHTECTRPLLCLQCLFRARARARANGCNWGANFRYFVVDLAVMKISTHER